MRLFLELKRKDKWIFVFFVIFGILYISATLYTDSTFENISVKWFSPLKEVEYEKILKIDREKIFLSFTNVKNYR